MNTTVVGIAKDKFKYSLDGRTSSSFVKGEEVNADHYTLQELSEKGLVTLESKLPSRDSSDKINELNTEIENLNKKVEELEGSSNSDLLEKIDSLEKENEDLKVKLENTDEPEDVKKVKDDLEKLINDKLDVDIDKRKGIVNIVSSLIDYLQSKPEETGE